MLLGAAAAPSHSYTHRLRNATPAAWPLPTPSTCSSVEQSCSRAWVRSVMTWLGKYVLEVCVLEVVLTCQP